MESALVASRAITQKEQRRVQPLDSAAAERVVVVAIIEDIEPRYVLKLRTHPLDGLPELVIEVLGRDTEPIGIGRGKHVALTSAPSAPRTRWRHEPRVAKHHNYPIVCEQIIGQRVVEVGEVARLAPC